MIVAMRGRPQNEKNVQRLEVNQYKGMVSNTITTVEKDNLVLLIYENTEDKTSNN